MPFENAKDARINLRMDVIYEWLYPTNLMCELSMRAHAEVKLRKAAHDLTPVIEQLILTYLHKEVQ